jgi:hypothetical protein
MKESYRETILEWIGDLKDKDPHTEEELALLRHLYEMLAREWYEERYYDPPKNDQRKRVQR